MLIKSQSPTIMNKVSNETSNLYNIEEDKEVESSFQYEKNNNFLKKINISSSPASNAFANLNQSNTNNKLDNSSFLSNLTNNNMSISNVSNGRITPACFPGRTTPDFRHTTSFFEQQGTRASIVSPLTINSGIEIIPIAVAFNETIHAYFKMGGDQSKFKVKCFGCMKISFPFAILKLIGSEFPQLEFKLNNLHIVNQDLKVNSQLLNRITPPDSCNQSFVSALSTANSPFEANNSVNSSFTSMVSSNSTNEHLQFQFIGSKLVNELKQQHQQNKLAAFFNFELLKYEFKYSNTPLVLNAQWSKNVIENTIELNLDYAFNFSKNLSQVNFMTIMPLKCSKSETDEFYEKICLISSEPKALIQETDNKIQVLWQIPTVSANGCIRAKFSIECSSQAQTILEKYYQPVYAKFHIDNDTLSQVKFDILSSNYKLSLLKERIESGKYFCNYDQQSMVNSVSSDNQELVNIGTVKKPSFAGNLSTSIGSTVDILLNH